MLKNIDHMTMNEISAEILRLANLEKTGDITVAQKRDLQRLRFNSGREQEVLKGRTWTL